MTKVLSALILLVIILFSVNVSNKTHSLAKAGYSSIYLDIQDGSLCGKNSSGWVCDSIYMFQLTK